MTNLERGLVLSFEGSSEKWQARSPPHFTKKVLLDRDHQEALGELYLIPLHEAMKKTKETRKTLEAEAEEDRDLGEESRLFLPGRKTQNALQASARSRRITQYLTVLATSSTCITVILLLALIIHKASKDWR